MIQSLLRRELAKKGIHLSTARIVERLAEIREITLLYPAPAKTKEPFARTSLVSRDDEQRALIDALQLNRYQTA